MRLHHILIALCCIANSLAASAAAQPKQPDPPLLLRDQDAQISEYIREVFQDRDGVYWFGTNGDGLARFDGANLTYISREQGLGGTASRGILQEKGGAMWFGTDGGVSRYEKGAFTNYTTVNGLSDNQIWSMMLDKSDTLWVGTQEGVCRFDGKAFVPFPLPRIAVDNPQSRFSPKVVFGLCEDQAGNIWFGTDGEGAHKYDGKSFTSYTTKDGLAGNQVRSAFCDSRGRVWLGTDGGGVSCYDGKSFRNFTSKDGLNGDRVFLVFEDSKSNLWFATLGAGACRYDGTTFTPFREDRGLTRTHVQSMFEDKNGTLWFGCSGGLFRYDGDNFVNVTRNGPWHAPAHVPVPPKPAAALDPANPLAPFARMLPGEWQVTFEGGSRQFDRWTWGPGRFSISAQTYGADGAGNPWRTFDLFYWDPTRKQVRAIGFHPDVKHIGRGVFVGTMNFDPAADKDKAVANGRFDLYQTGYGRRTKRSIARRWAFDGPDDYHAELLEDTGTGFERLINPAYSRSLTLSPLPPVADADAAPSGPLAAFKPLTGRLWQSQITLDTGEALDLRTTVEWIPYSNVILARVTSPGAIGEAAHLLDIVIFQHSADDSLCFIALSQSGELHEGTLSVDDQGAIGLDLKPNQPTAPAAAQLDINNDGEFRTRIWSGEASARTLLFDVRHTVVGTPKRPS